MRNPKIQGRKESLILRELTLILTKEMDDEILKSISISEVRLLKDNEEAKVYYTFIPFSNQNITEETVAQVLEDNKKKIRMRLASKIDGRSVPELNFVYDTSLDNANNIEQILKDVNAK